MLSRLILFICGWRRAASVSSATVQRCAPGGGSEQASAVTCASASAAYVLGLPDRGSSWSAKSTPPFRYAARVRRTAVRPTVEYLHDLPLRELGIQRRQDMGPIELPSHLFAFGTKLIHDQTVPFVQAQLCLSHARCHCVPQVCARIMFRYLRVTLLVVPRSDELFSRGRYRQTMADATRAIPSSS